MTFDDFAKTQAVTMTATFAGQRHDDPKWVCYLWKCRLRHDGRTYDVDFRMGLGHVKVFTAHEDAAPLAALKAAKVQGSKVERTAYATFAVPTQPTLPAVLQSLALDARSADETFESWCADFGYDTDSRKAEAAYRACQDTRVHLLRLFGHSAYEALMQCEES